MTTIETIRAEIKRNRQAIRVLNEHTAPEQMSKTCAIFQYSDSILSELLSFLDTLEESKKCDGCNNVKGCVTCVNGDQWTHYEKSEIPINQDELEKEIGSYMSNKWKFGCVTSITPVVLLHFTTEDLKECARHFAQWGADHTPLPGDTVLFNKGVEEGKRLMMEEFPKWKKIKAGERLPCPAYVWTIAYDNYPDCFEGRLMPNIQGVKVGRDTWYLPVDVIHNLPKEDEK